MRRTLSDARSAQGLRLLRAVVVAVLREEDMSCSSMLQAAERATQAVVVRSVRPVQAATSQCPIAKGCYGQDDAVHAQPLAAR